MSSIGEYSKLRRLRYKKTCQKVKKFWKVARKFGWTIGDKHVSSNVAELASNIRSGNNRKRHRNDTNPWPIAKYDHKKPWKYTNEVWRQTFRLDRFYDSPMEQNKSQKGERSFESMYASYLGNFDAKLLLSIWALKWWLTMKWVALQSSNLSSEAVSSVAFHKQKTKNKVINQLARGPRPILL